jgi:hypothetical protein
MSQNPAAQVWSALPDSHPDVAVRQCRQSRVSRHERISVLVVLTRVVVDGSHCGNDRRVA